MWNLENQTDYNEISTILFPVIVRHMDEREYFSKTFYPPRTHQLQTRRWKTKNVIQIPRNLTIFGTYVLTSGYETISKMKWKEKRGFRLYNRISAVYTISHPPSHASSKLASYDAQQELACRASLHSWRSPRVILFHAALLQTCSSPRRTVLVFSSFWLLRPLDRIIINYFLP